MWYHILILERNLYLLSHSSINKLLYAGVIPDVMDKLFIARSKYSTGQMHDDVIKWKHFPRYRLFVWHRSPSQMPVTQGFDVFFELHLNK